MNYWRCDYTVNCYTDLHPVSYPFVAAVRALNSRKVENHSLSLSEIKVGVKFCLLSPLHFLDTVKNVALLQ